MTCSSCGRALTDETRFCPSCGTPASDSDALTIAAVHYAEAPVSPSSMRPHSGQDGAGSASRSSLEGRFPPGTLLASRYRIVALVGSGGMGDVYRAEDLVLGQPVALKFLPDAIAADADRIERFRAEVRVARDVSHPNVCRVYDIGETGGHPFLSMEFIDGENLSSLLRRIGRLPHDTAVDMARQLCAGLAAAHERGVLHRDLKPANVMIDGRGKVRLADFGLASVAEAAADHVLAGTPAYMAPELFDRQPPSIGSDIYALGLVLYEMFAGRAAFAAGTVGEMARLQRDSMPTSLSRLLTDADPIVERVIQRCIAKDPGDRPASALAVAAALPGGDPLAAALAAGETPSPEMVAAAGGVGALSPGVALAGAVAVLAGLAVVVLLSARTQALRYAPATRAPELLADQAHSIVQRLGYTLTAPDTNYGFTVTDYLTYLRDSDVSASRWNNLRPGQPPGFTFWYRESPAALFTDNFNRRGRVSLLDPPLRTPGEIALMLDLKGRLHQLFVVPARMEEGTAAAADWGALFREAGMDLSRFTPSASRWTPPIYADTRAAWDGVYPERQDVPIHVEAAAAAGKPVFFQIYEPWSRTTLLQPARPRGAQIAAVVLFTVGGGLLAGALMLVRRNLRLGRGDQAGAFRLALVLCACHVAGGLIGGDFALGLPWVTGVLTAAVGRGLLTGMLAWILYVALEPDLRRRSPHMLISWSRVLAGRFTDPLVGRDILIGVAGAVASQLLTQVGYLAPGWFGGAPGVSLPLLGGPVVSVWQGLGATVSLVSSAVLLATSFVLLIFLLTLALRRRALVVAVVLILMSILAIGQSGFTLTTVLDLVVVLMTAIIVVRFGLLAFVIMSFMLPVLDHTPLTFDATIWYSGQSWLALAICAGLALFGVKTAVAGRPLFSAARIGD